jgi:hypothetical protein
MKRAVSLLVFVPLALVLACGSAEAKTYNVRNVERAFSQAGAPFQQEFNRPANPYLQPSGGRFDSMFPRAARNHLQTFMVAQDSHTFALQMAFVYDSAKNAGAALGTLSRFAKSDNPVICVRKLNVVTLVSAEDGSKITRWVRRAIAALK